METHSPAAGGSTETHSPAAGGRKETSEQEEAVGMAAVHMLQDVDKELVASTVATRQAVGALQESHEREQKMMELVKSAEAREKSAEAREARAEAREAAMAALLRETTERNAALQREAEARHAAEAIRTFNDGEGVDRGI